MERAIIIGVMGPGRGASEKNQITAKRLGQFIAQKGWVLLTGGRAEGVMDAANRGARENHGLTLGILPGDTSAGASPALVLALATGMGNGRNVINILASDILVVCGFGLGAGTLSEIGLAMKSQKPLIVLTDKPEITAFLPTMGYHQLCLTETFEQATAIISREVAQLVGKDQWVSIHTANQTAPEKVNPPI